MDIYQGIKSWETIYLTYACHGLSIKFKVGFQILALIQKSSKWFINEDFAEENSFSATSSEANLRQLRWETSVDDSLLQNAANQADHMTSQSL